MCYQCLAESKTIIENIFGEYKLQIATKDVYDLDGKIIWAKDAYALVRYNDPDVIFNDIVFGYDEDKNEKQYDDECKKIEILLNSLSFYISYCLCENMLKENYDQVFNGFAEFYLYDLISAKLQDLT